MSEATVDTGVSLTENDTLEVPLAELRPALEAVLMVADQPLDESTLASAVGYPVSEVVDALAALAEEYAVARRGFELRNVAGGWRYYTREEFAPVVEKFVLDGQQTRLTQAALETLAVVAYKQPVSRSRVSAVRGVNVDGVMRTLLTRGLVEEAGTDQETGAHLYRTSNYFLERIGVTSLEELPELAPFLPGVDDYVDEDQESVREVPEAAVARARTRRRLDRVRRAVREVETDEDGMIRLQKLLAQSGVASRRKCEEIMLAGLVEVDGEIVTRLGTKVDPRSAVIRVDGRRLPPVSAHVYLVLNKPRGVVSTMSDPEGRPTLSDYVADRPERLFHVGRLDTDTDGLILLTNDGDFAQKMAHPSYEVEKSYVAEVEGVVSKATLATLLAGVTLEDGPVQVREVRVRSSHNQRSIVELVIHEGRNRIVRRLLDHVGHPVQRLSRTRIGPVRLADLKTGKLRELDDREVGTLLDVAGL